MSGPIRRDPPAPPIVVAEATRLECIGGSSDKQYFALLCRLDGEWAAIVAWGPRSRWNLPWQEIARMTTPHRARQALDRQIAAKVRRGYAVATLPRLPEGFILEGGEEQAALTERARPEVASVLPREADEAQRHARAIEL